MLPRRHSHRKLYFRVNTIAVIETEKQVFDNRRELAEKAKVRIRQIRREINAGIKKDQDESLITEDESEKNLDAVQKTTDLYIKKIDTLLAWKEKEIKTI